MIQIFFFFDLDPQPTVTVIIRGPFGRHAWTMQLRHLPRHKSGTKHQHMSNPGRPIPINDVGIKHDIRHQHFPDSIERIPICKAWVRNENINANFLSLIFTLLQILGFAYFHIYAPLIFCLVVNNLWILFSVSYSYKN